MTKLADLETAAKAINSRPRYVDQIVSAANPAYGIPRDGTSDCASAINAMIQAVPTGTTIMFPPGVYVCSTPITLKSGVILTGGQQHYRGSDMTGGVILKASASMAALVTGPTDALYYSGVTQMTLNGANLATRCVYLQKPFWAKLTGLVLDSPIDEYLVLGQDGSSGFACVVEDILGVNGLQGTYSAYTGGLTVAGTDHYVSRCELSGNNSTYTSNKSSGFQSGIVVSGSNNFIHSCVSEFTETGVVVSGGVNRLIGVRADHQAGNGWVVSGGSNALVGCGVDRAGQNAANTFSGFQVAGVNNAIVGPGVSMSTGTLKYVLEDQSNGWDAMHRNDWSGLGTCAYGTAFFHGQPYAGAAPQISRHIQRPASAATAIDVTNAGIIYLASGGSAVTLSSITGGVTGQTIDLIPSDGNYTLSTAAATTRSGSNYTLPANLPTTLVCTNGTTWMMRN